MKYKTKNMIAIFLLSIFLIGIMCPVNALREPTPTPLGRELIPIEDAAVGSANQYLRDLNLPAPYYFKLELQHINIKNSRIMLVNSYTPFLNPKTNKIEWIKWENYVGYRYFYNSDLMPRLDKNKQVIQAYEIRIFKITKEGDHNITEFYGSIYVDQRSSKVLGAKLKGHSKDFFECYGDEERKELERKELTINSLKTEELTINTRLTELKRAQKLLTKTGTEISKKLANTKAKQTVNKKLIKKLESEKSELTKKIKKMEEEEAEIHRTNRKSWWWVPYPKNRSDLN